MRSISRNLGGYICSLALLLFFHLGCSCNRVKPARSVKQSAGDALLGPTKKKVYFFHGLWQNAGAFTTTIEQLSNSLRSQGLVVDIEAFQESLTSKHSIERQGRDAFEAIKNRVKDEPACDIILLGHSEGGLRAAEVVALNERAACPLHIKGLITLGTPWEGAPAAGISEEKVKKFLNEKPVHCLVKGINAIDPTSMQVTSAFFISSFFNLYFPMHNPGVQDMVPGSPFLQQLAADISAVSDVPILVVGGSNGNIHHFLKASSHTGKAYVSYYKSLAKVPAKPLNGMYARLFAGGWDVKNDLVVPLSSQLAAGIPYPLYERCIIPDAVHDFIPFLDIPPEAVIYRHPVALARIEGFIKKHFYGS